MTLLLARHGQTDWNLEPARCQGWAEVELNEAGRTQARDLGRALAGRGLELVVSSHLTRARQTAELVCEELATASTGDLRLVLDPRLAEAHCGDWETRLFSEIVEEDSGSWRAYREQPERFRFPGGESLAAQQRRVLAALRDVARDGRRALLVTHGGSIRVARCLLSGRGLAAFHHMETSNGGLDELETEALVERVTAFLGDGAA